MDWDGLAEQESQRLFAGWLKILMRVSPALPLKLAAKHCPDRQAIEASDFTTGSYNMCSVVTFEDGFKALVRFPIMGRSRFRVEKTNDELLAMGYITPRTRIRVPQILGTGMWECGPYIVTAYVEGVLLSKCLKDATQSTLRPDLSDAVLGRAYGEMAKVMLELYKLPFPRIGTIGWNDGTWRVAKRPLTLNMNELVRVGNYPPKHFSQDSFQSATDYFEELASQQFCHLKYQRNKAVTDETDCRKKYIARCLFRQIASQIPTEKGPFRLFCDDFRPSNVIVASESNFAVTGVIDWEYTYIAPVEFSRAAPWWLLLESPEEWESDLHEFLGRYKPRLELFLKAIKACEDEQIQDGTLKESDRLSNRMAQSMDNGVFWFCLAARKSFMFDDIYWTFLDEMFFGPRKTFQDRLSLLSQEERDGLDAFVQEKMSQAQESRLDEHMTLDEVMDL